MTLTDPEALEDALNGGHLEALPDEIRAFAWITLEATDAARVLVREMSGPERAVLSFYLSELSRLVEEEDISRTTADRRRARVSQEEKTNEDIVQGHLRDI